VTSDKRSHGDPRGTKLAAARIAGILAVAAGCVRLAAVADLTCEGVGVTVAAFGWLAPDIRDAASVAARRVVHAIVTYLSRFPVGVSISAAGAPAAARSVVAVVVAVAVGGVLAAEVIALLDGNGVAGLELIVHIAVAAGRNAATADADTVNSPVAVAGGAIVATEVVALLGIVAIGLERAVHVAVTAPRCAALRWAGGLAVAHCCIEAAAVVTRLIGLGVDVAITAPRRTRWGTRP